MKIKIVEIACDYCGCAEYYPPGNVDRDARSYGWTITRKGKHYDRRDCYLAASRIQQPHKDRDKSVEGDG